MKIESEAEKECCPFLYRVKETLCDKEALSRAAEITCLVVSEQQKGPG